MEHLTYEGQKMLINRVTCPHCGSRNLEIIAANVQYLSSSRYVCKCVDCQKFSECVQNRNHGRRFIVFFVVFLLLLLFGGGYNPQFMMIVVFLFIFYGWLNALKFIPNKLEAFPADSDLKYYSKPLSIKTFYLRSISIMLFIVLCWLWQAKWK